MPLRMGEVSCCEQHMHAEPAVPGFCAGEKETGFKILS